jgi:hypothetical protein
MTSFDGLVLRSVDDHLIAAPGLLAGHLGIPLQ